MYKLADFLIHKVEKAMYWMGVMVGQGGGYIIISAWWLHRVMQQPLFPNQREALLLLIIPKINVIFLAGHYLAKFQYF